MFCLPELKEVLIDLLQDHCSDTDHLAKQLGVGHNMVIYWDLRLDRLVGEAKEALNLVGIFLKNEEDLDNTEIPTVSAQDKMQPRTEILTVSQPDAMQPRAVFTTVSQPDTMQPRTVVPTVSKPDTMQPRAVFPTVSQLDTMQPRAVFPTVLQPDTMPPRAVFPTVSQPDTMQPRKEILAVPEPEATQEEPGKQRAVAASGLGATANTTQPIIQVQVSIVKTKDVALNLPEGYKITGGTLAEADTDTKPRQSPDTRMHPGPAARGDDNGGHRQHGQVLTHQGRKLVESIRARETSAYMSLLVATFLFTALMVGLIPAGRYPAQVAKHKTGRSASTVFLPRNADYTLLTTMEPMSKHKGKQLKQGFTSLMQMVNLPPLSNSKEQQAILRKELSNHTHPTMQTVKQSLEEQNRKKEKKSKKAKAVDAAFEATPAPNAFLAKMTEIDNAHLS